MPNLFLFKVVVLIGCCLTLGFVGGLVYTTQVWLPNATIYTTITDFSEASVTIYSDDPLTARGIMEYETVELEAIPSITTTEKMEVRYGSYSCSQGAPSINGGGNGV